MSDTSKYDLIIVGAGPAGSTAGYMLSKAGFKVLIIDKSVFPRHKLCAGCITQKTVRLLYRVFGKTLSELRENGILNFESDQYEIIYRDKLISKKTTDIPFHFVERYIYDDFLLKEAKNAGADTIEGERVLSFDIKRSTIRTSTGKLLAAHLIIGADGVNSTLRRCFPEERFNRKTWQNSLATGMEIFIDRSEMQKPVNHPVLYFDFVNYGYAWLFPNRDKLVAGLGGLNQDNKKQFLPSFQKFITYLGINRRHWNIKGYAFPYGNFLLEPAFKNIILVGDAAGFADPLLGEGIFYAQRSGELASQAILTVMKQNTGLETAIEEIANTYIRLLHEHMYPEFVYARKIRNFIFTRLNKFNYLPLKILFSIFGNKFAEAVHGIRSYRWMKKKDST